MYRPSISIIIPTLNAESVLEDCLISISSQKYPKNKIEIIVADGHSTDGTQAIAKKYRAKVVPNPKKTGEAGKAAALKYAKGELIALIDSDNILPDKNWLSLMVTPFSDKDIVASEPIEYTYRKKDPWLTRYFAMLGMNDPICLFIGNYDRISTITGKWTNLKFSHIHRDKYLKVKLDHEPIPTIGANGTIFKREVILKSLSNGYLFDIDILLRVIRLKGLVYVAKVKTGIIHTFVEDDPLKFFRKQMRRINDMSYHQSKKTRDINWEKSFFWKIIFFQIQCLLIFPILFQMVKGYIKKPDSAWFFHPIAIYSTLLIYIYGWIKGKFIAKEYSRINWKQ